MEKGPTGPREDAISRPLKSGRAGKAKVRTGCKTCKIRRVKCDEGKPSCKRCQLRGRICDGYPHLKRPQSNPVLFPQAKPASFILKIKSQNSIPVHPLDYPDWTPAELRSFEYFRCCTAFVMSHWVRGPFWKYQLPQLGQSEITIRKAMIGLSKYHEGCERFRISMQSGRGIDETDTDVLTNGVEEYNTAISQLAKLLANGKSADLVALITCGLFIILDVGWGDFPKAIIHIHNGVKILDRWKTNLLMSNRAIVAGSLEQSVIDLFGSISHQTSLDDPDPLTALRTEWPPFEEFKTLEMAEIWHEHINRKSIQLVRIVVLKGRTSELDDTLAEIRTRSNLWARSFRSLVASMTGRMSLEEDEIVDELWIRHLIPEVMLWSSLNEENGEPVEVLNSLLRQAEALHRKRRKHDREMVFKIFCFTAGLIPALRIISHKSKDEALRRKATLVYSWSAPSMLETTVHATPPAKKGANVEKEERSKGEKQILELELRPGTQQVRLILNAGQKDGQWEVIQEALT